MYPPNNQISQKNTIFKPHKSIRSVADIFNRHLLAYGNRYAIRMDTGTDYTGVSFVDYHRHIGRMIRFFNREKAEQKVVATLCKNRIEWDMTAMATFYTANILFPLDTKFSLAELNHLLQLCRPDYILLSSSQLLRFRSIAIKLSLETKVIVADLFHVFEDNDGDALSLMGNEMSMKTINKAYTGSDNDLRESILLDDPTTIVGHYATAGTTSLPKIVQISHGNIIAEVNCAFDVINLRPNEDLLNISPYTHISTLVEFLVSKSRGFTVTYFTREPDDDDVLEDEIVKLTRQGVRIKAILAAPGFWINLVKDVLEEMKNKPVMEKLYEHLSNIEKNETLQDMDTIDKAKLTTVRLMLRNKLGGYFSHGISSSAKLDGAIVKILGKLGITCIDMYDAPECTGIISQNKLDDTVEQIEWNDGSLIDPQHISNLLARNIFVKDALVAQYSKDDDYLSVFIFPDYKRIENDPEYRQEIKIGVSRRTALKKRCVEAIRYAESVTGITPELNKEVVYILSQKLEKPLTHKIKYLLELQRLDDAERI